MVERIYIGLAIIAALCCLESFLLERTEQLASYDLCCG